MTKKFRDFGGATPAPAATEILSGGRKLMTLSEIQKLRAALHLVLGASAPMLPADTLESVKAALGYCIDEGCEHRASIHECLNARGKTPAFVSVDEASVAVAIVDVEKPGNVAWLIDPAPADGSALFLAEPRVVIPEAPATLPTGDALEVARINGMHQMREQIIKALKAQGFSV